MTCRDSCGGGVVAFRTHRVPINKDQYSGSKEQYFLPELIHIEDGEVFVDGGAYIGDTIDRFIEVAKQEKVQYSKIVAFEPNQNNLQVLRKKHRNNDKVRVIRKGLSDREFTLLFKEDGGRSLIVKDEAQATTKIPVIDIDHVPECRDATWIKMDIEGAEMAALHGAKETILRNHPKLTICTYHSAEDMIRIPEYIHELVPEYRLYIRQHTMHAGETVLYALI